MQRANVELPDHLIKRSYAPACGNYSGEPNITNGSCAEIDKTLGIKVEIHNLHYPLTMKSSKLHPLMNLLTPDLSVSGGINYILI